MMFDRKRAILLLLLLFLLCGTLIACGGDPIPGTTGTAVPEEPARVYRKETERLADFSPIQYQEFRLQGGRFTLSYVVIREVKSVPTKPGEAIKTATERGTVTYSGTCVERAGICHLTYETGTQSIEITGNYRKAHLTRQLEKYAQDERMKKLLNGEVLTLSEEQLTEQRTTLDRIKLNTMTLVQNP